FSSFLDFFGQGELRLPIYSGWAQWRGLGVGMATSSNVFFTTPSTKPQALADSTVSSMKITDAVVSEEIVRNQVNHIGPLLAGLTVFSEESVFESDMNRLLSGVSGPISDNNPVVMVLGKSGSPGDYHAVSAFKVAENHSSGTATIFLYDSESPGLATTATVDLGTNAFEYGNFDQAALISQTAITLSQTTSELFHDSVLGPFKDAFVSLIGQESMDFIGHASPVRMLITDPSTGNRTGFVDGTSLVNEIALAQVIEVPNPGGNPAFAFYLPTGPAYQITFIGFEAGSMYIDIIRPNSGTDARGVTFQEVAVDSGTVVTIADLSTFIETDATISIDFDGDGAVDSQVAADAVQDLVVEQPTGIVGGGRTDIPDSFALKSNRPNPFNPTTRISFEVASESHITLTIYNILGQEIVTLVDGAHTPGVYDVIWNGTDGYGKVAPSGVYFYRLLSSSGYNRTRRMLLLK
ncbi:MAG: T9SS type A sorting domain-containing protein, partial [Candidatus Latescibacteria bacterium]|nr:T9SS type A sorting domain-containing protein [Candidatus Latescibacterota bacterium]